MKKERELLQKPFDSKDIEWRIQQSGIDKNNKPWAMVLAYITNRAIMERLDDVFGIGGWKNEFKPTPTMSGTLCGISVKYKDEWVTKWDGADDTAVEGTKGGLSASMKRAAVQWGPGRYLYHLEVVFAKIVEKNTAGAIVSSIKGKGGENIKFYWLPPELPNFALPIMPAQIREIKTISISKGVLIEDILKGYNYTDLENMTKEIGVNIIQVLSKKKDLSPEALEAFTAELEKEKQ